MILTSLAGQPRHGYAITQDIESFAGVTLGPGTLYGALSRLERRGLIQLLPPEDGRRPYQLTSLGVEVLDAQSRRLSLITATARSRLHRPPTARPPQDSLSSQGNTPEVAESPSGSTVTEPIADTSTPAAGRDVDTCATPPRGSSVRS
jgi:DNA-binding PadR family transcriptional regulator